MKTKKLLALLMAGAMSVSMLSGCSNGSDNSSTAQNSGEEPTGTITLKVPTTWTSSPFRTRFWLLASA